MVKVEIDSRSGFCGGVIRAITTAEDFLSKGDGRLWSLGAIVHNEEELARLGGTLSLIQTELELENPEILDRVLHAGLSDRKSVV